jgi:hypothetical protein
MTDANLSGTRWWRANQGKYPNSQDVYMLEPGFRSNVEAFVSSLRQAGAAVHVSSTRRNSVRAFLMHYSWKVAYGEVDPKDVPARVGLSIVWDHGDMKLSRQGAREMVNLFGMAHVAALTSNHILGKAIDMNIRWKGSLVLTQPAPLLVTIDDLPRTGQNRNLHAVGAEVFDVRKLTNDPPHWSHNGR